MMKIEIESTKYLTEIDGNQVRLWNGVTERGANVMVFVSRIAVSDNDPTTQEVFENELSETGPPSEFDQKIDLRNLL